LFDCYVGCCWFGCWFFVGCHCVTVTGVAFCCSLLFVDLTAVPLFCVICYVVVVVHYVGLLLLVLWFTLPLLVVDVVVVIVPRLLPTLSLPFMTLVCSLMGLRFVLCVPTLLLLWCCCYVLLLPLFVIPGTFVVDFTLLRCTVHAVVVTLLLCCCPSLRYLRCCDVYAVTHIVHCRCYVLLPFPRCCYARSYVVVLRFVVIVVVGC